MSERLSILSYVANALRGFANKLDQRRLVDLPDVGEINSGQLIKKDPETGNFVGINMEDVAGDSLATNSEFAAGTDVKAPTVNQTKNHVSVSLATGLATKLNKEGDPTQVVKVAQGTAANEAVRVDQFDFAISATEALEDYNAS
jgi:hypothetical protein